MRDPRVHPARLSAASVSMHRKITQRKWRPTKPSLNSGLVLDEVDIALTIPDLTRELSQFSNDSTVWKFFYDPRGVLSLIDFFQSPI